MRLAADFIFECGVVLLGVAFFSALVRAWKRRDRHRLDLVTFITVLLLPTLLRGASAPAVLLGLGLGRSVPWALLRLVRHFRSVPAALTLVALLVGLAVPVAVFLAPASAAGLPPSSGGFAADSGGLVRGLSAAYVVVGLLALAIVFIVEARRSTGARARRLTLAGIGTIFFAFANAAGTVMGPSTLETAVAIAPYSKLARGLAFICFYFAFATPRPLLSRWRREEQANYLAEVMVRDPEERGRRAAEDLFHAAVRGVGGAVTFVALRGPADSSGLRVTAANDPKLVGRVFMPKFGLLARVAETGRAAEGVPFECEQDLADTVLAHGVNVLVVPILATSHFWGVVVVAQRRGALFPEDDLEMLSLVARNAATALDHGQLILERRERERREADRRLREIESRVELMLDSIKDYAMLVLYSDGRIAAWHLGAEHVFGHKREQITGVNAAPIFKMTPAEFSAWLDEARARGHAEREGPCLRADGTAFVGTTMIRPLIADGGVSPGLVVVTHDVTDRRNLEERLRQGQKMEAIGQLAGGVAHDFNNLLTAILGYADWLDRDLAGDPRREQVTEIRKAADRAADLTRQLLAFSRRQTLQPAAIDLGILTADLVPMLRRLIGEHVIIVDKTEAGLPPIMGDRSQIEQIVLNLAVNARDAMPDGGRLTITTSEVWLDGETPIGTATLPPGPYLRLDVSDTGTGMDADTQRRVFEPFFTTKDVGKGTGLGLSTVYGILQQMGGGVEVESAPLRGTAFKLYFPQATGIAIAQGDSGPAFRPHRDRETVLIVEEDQAVCTYLTSVLESHGYRVLAAEHASAALALTQSAGDRIDLVISDVVIPGSTGPELIRLLGQARPNLAALFISGHPDGVLTRHAAAVNGAPLLRKPFSSTELLAKVRQILSAA